ncbi:hypothetical protein FQN49_005804 [Arthroderma sp. PD_2]|nr:hypothetical protein FQN49_005804 [Arthroderma sp. PD_2]
MYPIQPALRARLPSLYPRLQTPFSSKWTVPFGGARASRFPRQFNDRCWLSNHAALCGGPFLKSPRTNGRDKDTSSPTISILDRHQLNELYHGRFPADYPFEVINLKASGAERLRILDAFENHKRIRITFDEEFSTTSIRNSPAPIHQWLLASIVNSFNSQLPYETIALADSRLEELNMESEMFPDLQFLYSEKGVGKLKPVLTAEIGFPQLYESLKHATQRLINETQNVNVSLMVNIKERPAFRSPVSRTSSGAYRHPVTKEEMDKESILKWLRSVGKDEEALPGDSNDPESPLFLLGTRWVGRIEGTLEVWTRDPKTKKAVRNLDPILFYGSKATLDHETRYIDARTENVDVGLCLSDIIPHAGEKFKKPLIIDWDGWRNAIELGKKSLAESRRLDTLESIEDAKEK